MAVGGRLAPLTVVRHGKIDLDGGVLVATLTEYVGADLDARRAAERLHIHVNTAHYRLGKIAERTSCDLHRLADLVEILIAARFVAAPR